MGKQTKVIKVEGVSLDAGFVAGLSREDWQAHAKERYFFLIGSNTPTDAERESLINRVYDLAHKEMGTEPAKSVKKATLRDVE